MHIIGMRSNEASRDIDIITWLADIMAHMERVLIQFTGEQIGGIRRRAEARDQSVSSLVREAVDAYLLESERAALVKRALASLDGFPGGPVDLAENHDMYIDDEARS